jgi:D-3-phosphoglycerate dehydrogenase
MEVWACDPVVEDRAIAAAGIRPASLEELLRACTAVSLHAPLSPATRQLLGAAELELLPAGSFVVNVSRAGLVDTTALLDALESGRLGGVALDVVDVEPPTLDAPAPAAARLIVNPHAGWYSTDAEEAVYRRAAEAVRDALEGRVPHGAVNRPSLRKVGIHECGSRPRENP